MSSNPNLATLFGAKSSDTFLGLKSCKSLTDLTAPIALIGAPCATPYRSVGAYCKNAPNALRKAISSMTSNIDRHNFDLGGPTFLPDSEVAVDCGDLPFNENTPSDNRKIIRSAIEQILQKQSVPIVIGGDDSIPIPMLQAFEGQGKFTVLQLDAHIDWRNCHMDEKMGLSSTMRRASEMLHIERILQIGSRGIGSGHTDDLQDALEWGVTFVTADDLHVQNSYNVLDSIPEASNIIICVDADIFDPSIVPGVIGRTPGGLGYYQVFNLIKLATERGRIAAISFVEYMPEADIDGLGGLVISRLITSSMGLISRQISDKC
ncbi:MAG: arginase family protein [Pseudomonadota bacterium]|nr:arginase family protein [Pseudomonadota bacterium]